jgi:IPT/TIG domain.
MAFDFPSSPAPDEVFTDIASGATYVWSGQAWKRQGGGSQSGATGIPEAPIDSVPYARRNAAWVPADLMTADRPILNTITPAAALVTDAPLTVTLAGSKFSVTAKVFLGNELMPSAFHSPSEMSFPIDPANHPIGPHVVTVNNTGLSSQPRTFTIT